MNGRLPAEVSSRPHQTTVEVAINTSVTYKCVSRTTDQIPVEEEKLQIDPNRKTDKSTIISYMVPNNVPNFEKTQGIVNKLADPYIPEFYLDMLGVNWNKFEKPVEKPSFIKLYKHEDIDPMKMMDLILRELNILKELEPRVTLKITKLLNTIMHFRVRHLRKGSFQMSRTFISSTSTSTELFHSIFYFNLRFHICPCFSFLTFG